MRVADYKDLRVCRLACESAMEIFELSKKFPSEENGIVVMRYGVNALRVIDGIKKKLEETSLWKRLA